MKFDWYGCISPLEKVSTKKLDGIALLITDPVPTSFTTLTEKKKITHDTGPGTCDM